MAVAGGPLAFSRRVALTGAYTLSIQRGQIVAGNWPPPHRARPKTTELERREWLRVMVQMVKWADPGTLATVQDEVGGTATLARDVMMMLIAGTAFAVKNEAGKWLLPVRFRDRLWNALDQIALHERGPLARHPQRWISVPPTTAGHVYTTNGAGQLPSWQAP